MRKKTLTVEDIEKRLKTMGGEEVNEKEFDSSEEYKNISNQVKKLGLQKPPQRINYLKQKKVLNIV